MKCVKSLKSQGVISEDVMMLDKMDSQKWEEHSDSGIIGGIENNELDKTLLSFMIVWLKENVPYIIKSIPEQNIDGK